MTDSEVKERAAWFGRGVPKAEMHCIGPTFPECVDRWLPKLRGALVRNSDDPPGGFATEQEAVAAAARFRDGCAAWAARH
jgi:hypothetical protein